MQLENMDPQLFRTILIMTVITFPLKGVALWRAAHSEQKVWYISMLVFNTFGLVELTYLFYFSKPQKVKKDKK